MQISYLIGTGESGAVSCLDISTVREVVSSVLDLEQLSELFVTGINISGKMDSMCRGITLSFYYDQF